MPRPSRRPRIARRRCEACGADLAAETRWLTLHDGARALRLCRWCTEDALAREDAETRWQLDWLEAVWALPPRRTGLGLGEDEASVS
jgi:hypothetical protein